jgi:hypothetical protein
MNTIEQIDKLPEEITITWHFSDVQSVEPTLSDIDAKRVLQVLKRCHDCNQGINWAVISDVITNMGLDNWRDK